MSVNGQSSGPLSRVRKYWVQSHQSQSYCLLLEGHVLFSKGLEVGSRYYDPLAPLRPPSQLAGYAGYARTAHALTQTLHGTGIYAHNMATLTPGQLPPNDMQICQVPDRS